MSINVIAPVILSAIFTGLASYFAFVITTRERLARMEERVRENQRKLEDLEEIKRSVHCLEAKDEVYWKSILPSLADQIHSPIHVRRDSLVDMLVGGHPLSFAELTELEKCLNDALKDDCIDGVKRMAASLLLGRARMELGDFMQCNAVLMNDFRRRVAT